MPPKLALRFFRWYCLPRLAYHIEGDLLEVYGERCKRIGKRKADLKFIIDVFSLCRPGIIRPVQYSRSHSPNHYHMISNYLKVALRNVRRYKTFSFINVFGLSIAMSVSLLVILVLADQYRYDRFNQKEDRIYRILSERSGSTTPFASTPPSLMPVLDEKYSIVEHVTSLVTGVGGDATHRQRTVEMRGFFADEHFLQIFDFDLKHGNREKALQSPNSLVISNEVSRKLFGSDNPIGLTVEFTDRGLHYLKVGKDQMPVPWGTFVVTGVIDDKPYRSHLRFDVLMSASSQKRLIAENKLADGSDNWDKSFTYALVREGTTREDLDRVLADVINHEYADSEPSQNRFVAQALSDITPGIMVNQPPTFQLPIGVYYVFGFIALIIMASACLNYISLSTARAITRAKEIGVRKVTGARRKDLVYQFLSESILTSCFALIISVVLLELIKPAFTGLWLNSFLRFDLDTGYAVYLIFAAFALATGLIGGLYPALYLSSFQPVKAIKNLESLAVGRLSIRKFLSASQFVVSLFFVITSILVYTQFRHFMNFQYGFNADQIVNVPLQGNTYEKVAEAFRTIPGIEKISASEYVPATGRTSGMDINRPDTGEPVNFRTLSVDEIFADNLDLTFVAGTNLPVTTDSASRFVVLNETAVHALGFERPVDAVGQILTQTWNKEPLEVVGVVADFWIKLPIGGERMEPAFLRTVPQNFSYANVKIASGNISATLTQMESAWKRIDQGHPFTFQFYEEELKGTHAGIFDVVSIVGYLAFIAVTIACLGMLGMAMYTTERKKKEVGIRKVLGAESRSIALMLSKEFLKILLVAICIGAPLSYFVNNLWLEIFPNRAPFGVGIVLLGTFILLMLGLLTIGSQTISASRTNPADSLKTE